MLTRRPKVVTAPLTQSGPVPRMVTPGRRLGRRLGRWLRRGDRSAVAVELAIIAVPFFVMFLGTMEIAYDLYVQAELDNAVELASRTVQVGSSHGIAGEKSAAFVASAVCPNLAGALDCSRLTVGVEPLTTGDYYSNPVEYSLTQAQANGGTGICTGTAAQMMVLKAWYDGPTFLGLLVPSFSTYYNNNLVHVTISTAGFVNEYFPGGQPC
jgi:Flp pilus assembly protein TadG